MQERIVIYDIDNNFGYDLSLSGTNDLQTCSALIRSEQRVLRRLLTNPGEYIWHPTYGAGLSSFVGASLTDVVLKEIRTRIISNIFLEESVSKNPSPIIELIPITDGLLCNISYIEQSTQQPIVLNFKITKYAFTA